MALFGKELNLWSKIAFILNKAKILSSDEGIILVDHFHPTWWCMKVYHFLCLKAMEA